MLTCIEGEGPGSLSNDGGSVSHEQGRLKMRSRRQVGGNCSVRRPSGLRFANLLKRKRVLVTGGAGFVGSHIVDQLVQVGCDEIIVVDNMITGRPENLIGSLQSGKVKLVVGDIRDRLLLKELVDGVDTVFHQAALDASHCIVDPRLALEVMVNAVFNLLEQCVKSSVRKIVTASSASVYGMANVFPTTEHHNPYSNRTLFGAAKCFGEGLMRSFNEMYGTNYVALRYFDVYGPRMDNKEYHARVLFRWTERLTAGLPPIVIGAGAQTMDMLHVEDVARANILAAISPVSDVALNVGSGKETSLLTLARILARVMDRPDLEPVFWEGRTNLVARRVADIDAARRTIGFESSVSLKDGLAGFVEWWRDRPATGIRRVRAAW